MAYECNQESSYEFGDLTKAVHNSWKWFLSVGVLLIILGIIAISAPLAAAIAIEILLGWIFVGSGIIRAIHLYQERKASGFLSKIVGALLYLAAGGILLLFPVRGVATLTLILAIFFILSGVLRIVTSLELRSLPNWGWILLSGSLAILLGIMIWTRWPSSSAWAIGLMVGIDFLFGGLSLVMCAIAMKKF
ncbi:MAG TPA: HdeD family acid-resistance protein [bacterium]|jgi:uncharacterized membrane protein HdeD (DUF308 family)|nr:HdeD family acid-resistance protein [Myxococcales bacterium]OQA62037.1 MAG: acid-resistance membrane protein [bacterium ADurb.Bin270]HPW45219.1 HdeD family acid-resistance protein [bacterium]HQG13050.1 HdeD family acid-resistance protein [bacterium]